MPKNFVNRVLIITAPLNLLSIQLRFFATAWSTPYLAIDILSVGVGPSFRGKRATCIR
jgi:hypothetical protein